MEPCNLDSNNSSMHCCMLAMLMWHKDTKAS